ncbi:hypothetical protein MPNT_10068 [Candidatus Methylacidithermus pantelleriae]|uniref:Uncharacterized protein n=1 Tax=Candidatus Methylacidithermus pantelleriae TaxID=2744239 RepID=A0A8J2BLU2_9BACT|nr:hypothetical protein MPNT_10068 [Candidatus Methylacidithermus pantelleriae]
MSSLGEEHFRALASEDASAILVGQRRCRVSLGAYRLLGFQGFAFAALAQLVEQRFRKARVVGSNPTSGFGKNRPNFL